MVTSPKSRQQTLDDQAIDNVALLLVQNYDIAAGMINNGLPEAQQLKPLTDPSFKDSTGALDRDKFNDYVRARAAELYDGDSDFAKKSMDVIDKMAPALTAGDPEKAKYLTLLKNHKAIVPEVAKVMDEYMQPIPIISDLLGGVLGLFGIHLPFPISGKVLSVGFQSLLKHGFDFAAIQKDIGDSFVRDADNAVAAKVDANTASAAKDVIAKVADEQMHPDPSAKHAETYATAKLNSGMDALMNGANATAVPAPAATKAPAAEPVIGNLTAPPPLASAAKPADGKANNDQLNSAVKTLLGTALQKTPNFPPEMLEETTQTGTKVFSKLLQDNAADVKSGNADAIAQKAASALMLDSDMHKKLRDGMTKVMGGAAGMIPDGVVNSFLISGIKKELTPQAMAQLQASMSSNPTLSAPDTVVDGQSVVALNSATAAAGNKKGAVVNLSS